MNIPGLPEGVEVIRIGIAGPEDFEIVGTAEPGVHLITKGARAGSMSQIIVRPAPGYQFLWNLRSLSFDAVKTFEAPAIMERTVKFSVTNQRDLDAVNDALDRIKALPGYIG